MAVGMGGKLWESMLAKRWYSRGRLIAQIPVDNPYDRVCETLFIPRKNAIRSYRLA